MKQTIKNPNLRITLKIQILQIHTSLHTAKWSEKQSLIHPINDIDK